MTTRKFTYRDATITIHRRRMSDRLDTELIVAMLMNETGRDNRGRFVRNYHRANSYAVLLASIDAVDGDAGFPIPPADAPEDELRAGYEAFLNADDGFYDAWLAALNAVNAPIGDPDTAPGVDDDPKGSAA